MKRILNILIFCIAFFTISGQEFKTKLSHSRVAINQNFTLTFELNTSGSSFSAPNLKDFQVLGGPNQSTSMSYVNGQMTQSLSFSYTLRPRSSGKFSIGGAGIKCNGKTLKSNKIVY